MEIEKLFNSLQEMNFTNLQKDLRSIGLLIGYFIIALLIVFLVLMLIDSFVNYDIDSLNKKKQKRTARNETGGGQEYYLRYWLWQRKKQKISRQVLASLTFDKMVYPKQKWKNMGSTKFPFRREVWINADSVDTRLF